VAIYDPWDFIWTNSNLLVLGMIHAKYCPIWCRSSWEDDFYISICKSLSPLGRVIHDPRDFIWTLLNPLVPRMFYVKYQCIPTSGSWEKDYLIFIKIFLILPVIGPQKGPSPLFEQIRIPIPQACFPPSLVEIGQVVLEKKSFKGKN